MSTPQSPCDYCKDRAIRVLAGEMFYIPRIRLVRNGDTFWVEVQLFWNDKHCHTVMKMAVPADSEQVVANVIGPEAPGYGGFKMLSNRQGNGRHKRA